MESRFTDVSHAAHIPDSELRDNLNSLLGDDTPAAENLRRGLVRRWTELDLAGAAPLMSLDIASRLEPCPERDDLLCHAGAQRAAAGPNEAAITWAAQIANPVLRERVLASLAVATAETDGQTAAAMVATSLQPGPLQELTAVQVAQRWFQQAPAAAAQWVASFPAGGAAAAAEESLNATRTISQH